MKLTWRRLDLTTRHEFATARGGIRTKQTLLVELEHDGVVGRGEAVPSALYSQTLESAEAALADMRDDLARRSAAGQDPLATEALVAPLLRRHDAQRAAVAAVDSALHDWAGRRLGVPLWRMLGLRRPCAPTSFTIGAADVDSVRQ
jgi:L-alanine-DL-glutamate epimerase-like enolase superfamily enzyme